MLKLILFLAICLSVNATEKSKYTRIEIRDLKNLRLEAIASRRYHKEATENHQKATEKKESKAENIEQLEAGYKRLQKKFHCGNKSCSHSRGARCYRGRSTLRKASSAIDKAELSLIKLKKNSVKTLKLVNSRKAQFSKFLKAYLALKNKY